LSLAVTVEDIMQWTLMGSSSTRLPVLLTMIVTTGLGLSMAGAQTSSQSAASGSGQYYVEFRSRQAWDYGHTFVVFGRVGETPGKKNVAGLSPKGDDPKMWLMGHYMPVPADTGPFDRMTSRAPCVFSAVSAARASGNAPAEAASADDWAFGGFPSQARSFRKLDQERVISPAQTTAR